MLRIALTLRCGEDIWWITAMLIAKSKRASGWGRSRASATNVSCSLRSCAMRIRFEDLGPPCLSTDYPPHGYRSKRLDGHTDQSRLRRRWGSLAGTCRCHSPNRGRRSRVVSRGENVRQQAMAASTCRSPASASTRVYRRQAGARGVSSGGRPCSVWQKSVEQCARRHCVHAVPRAIQRGRQQRAWVSDSVGQTRQAAGCGIWESEIWHDAGCLACVAADS